MNPLLAHGYAILTFIVLIFGFGYSVLYLSRTKRSEHPVLATLEIAMVGLATFSFISVVLNLVHIPLHIMVYVILALATPIYALMRSLGTPAKESSWSWRNWRSETNAYLLVLLIVLVAFFVIFHKGAFGYPYLEDDDPWLHAMGATYVGRELTYSVDPQLLTGPTSSFAFYLEPYPPTYDTMMGVLWQTNGSILWTLKLFNVLLCTLALAFFYLCASVYLKSELRALFATIILAALPSFMSHFIWNQTLALAIFPVALYAVIKGLEDDSWIIPAVIAVASMMVTQPVVSAVFGIMMLLLVGLVFLHELLANRAKKGLRKRFPQAINGLIIGAAGLALSFLFWGRQFIKWGVVGTLKGHSGGFASWNYDYVLQKYGWHEIIFPPLQSRIDQATGWGIAVFVLLIVALIMMLVAAKRTFDLRKSWLHLHITLWLLFLLLITFGPSVGLPGYGSSRAWAYLAIPLVLFLTEGVFILINTVTKEWLVRVAIALILLAAIVMTSAPAKVAVQTANWVPGVHWTYGTQNGAPAPIELSGYVQMRQALPANTRVYAFCGDDKRTIGFDMQSEPWDLELSQMRAKGLDMTADEAFSFLETHRFEYITLDASCLKEHGENATQRFTTDLVQTGRLEPIITQPGFILAKVH